MINTARVWGRMCHIWCNSLSPLWLSPSKRIPLATAKHRIWFEREPEGSRLFCWSKTQLEVADWLSIQTTGSRYSLAHCCAYFHCCFVFHCQAVGRTITYMIFGAFSQNAVVVLRFSGTYHFLGKILFLHCLINLCYISHGAIIPHILENRLHSLLLNM